MTQDTTLLGPSDDIIVIAADVGFMRHAGRSRVRLPEPMWRVDLDDFGVFSTCMTNPVGPTNPPIFVARCGCFDMDIDGDVDFRDFWIFQLAFNGAD